ncbi:MAG: tetratricopeptide repeat protein [Chitinophagales bacterium]|nr:tetratricopeptide repeat protein [Chitinophagales bacterium]
MEADPSAAFGYAKEAMDQSKKLNYTSGYYIAMNIKGVCNDMMGKYDSALYCYNEALKIPLQGFEAFKGGIYSNIGLVYWNLDNYVLALKNFNKAKQILSTTDKYEFTANVINNLGLIYHDIKDYNQSNENFEEAIQLSLNNKDTIGAIGTVINLAINYFEINQNEKGKKLLLTYSKYVNKLDDFYKSEFLAAMAASEIHTSITASTEEKLLKALELKKKIGHTLGVANINISLSELYSKKNQYHKSNRFAYNALQYTEELSALKKKEQVYDILFANYLELNQKDSSLKYYNLYKTTIDTIFSNSRAKAIAKEQIAFKTFEKEKENLSLTIENTKIQARNRLIIFSSIALLGLSGIAFWILWYRKKKNALIEQRELIHQAVTETELIERERIARDLHDSVGQKLSVVKMQLSSKDTDIKAATYLLDNAIQDVRNVSHNLLPSDLDKGLIPAIESMSNQVNSVPNNLTIHLNISPEVRKLYIDHQHTLLIYRMIQELLHNAIKYAEAKNIYINMDCEKLLLKLDLSDDGKGFDVDSLTRNNGIGIQNISDRITQLIGSIQLSSKLGKGTQYHITIPL